MKEKYGNRSGKITGMILGLCDTEQERLVSDANALLERAEEAYSVLLKHERTSQYL